MLRKNYLLLLSIFIIAGVFFLYSCQKEDFIYSDNNTVHQMFLDAGFKASTASPIDADQYYEFKSVEEVRTFLAKIENNKRDSGSVKISLEENAVGGKEILSLNFATKPQENNFRRMKSGMTEDFEFLYTISEDLIFKDLTIACEKVVTPAKTEWKINNVPRYTVGEIDQICQAGGVSVSVTGSKKFKMEVTLRIFGLYEGVFYDFNGTKTYDYELEIDEYPLGGIEARLYWKGSMIALDYIIPNF